MGLISVPQQDSKPIGCCFYAWGKFQHPNFAEWKSHSYQEAFTSPLSFSTSAMRTSLECEAQVPGSEGLKRTQSDPCTFPTL